jgi:hypothetical protein
MTTMVVDNMTAVTYVQMASFEKIITGTLVDGREIVIKAEDEEFVKEKAKG